MRDRISLIWVIVIILVLLYVPILMWVWQSPKAKEWGLELRGPIVVYKTQRGKKAMERIGSHRKLCRAMATFSNFVAVILMGVMILLMAAAVRGIPLRIKGEASVVSVTSLGLNVPQFLIFGVLALIVAMIIHEFAHGVQSKSNGVRVESSGLMYAVVPLGAFVEMNEEDSKKATLKERMSIYSAGISINFIVAMISFAIFAMLMLAPLGNVNGVSDDSVGIYSISGSSPNSDILSAGNIILTIDGEEINAEEGISDGIFRGGEGLAGGKYDITYMIPDGTEKTGEAWFGIYIEDVVPESPASMGGLPKYSILKSIDGTEITGMDSFKGFLADTLPNQEITVTYFDTESEGTEKNVIIKLGGKEGDIGYMGVYSSYSGMMFTTPEFVLGKATNPIYGESSSYGIMNSLLKYPFQSMEGFSPIPTDFQWWFEAPGGGIFWIFGALLYWMFWVNLLLGITNALPLMPFDGGHLFKGWITQILDKMKYKDEKAREEVAKNITGAVSGLMGFLLLLIVFAMIFT